MLIKQEIGSVNVKLGDCPMQLFNFWSRDIHPVQNLLLCTKFHRNHEFSLRYDDITIFKMAAVRHLGIILPPYETTHEVSVAGCSCLSNFMSIWYTDLTGLPYVEKNSQYVKPFSPNTETWRTDGRTDRIAISISRASMLTRDKKPEADDATTACPVSVWAKMRYGCLKPVAPSGNCSRNLHVWVAYAYQ